MVDASKKCSVKLLVVDCLLIAQRKSREENRVNNRYFNWVATVEEKRSAVKNAAFVCKDGKYAAVMSICFSRPDMNINPKYKFTRTTPTGI